MDPGYPFSGEPGERGGILTALYMKHAKMCEKNSAHKAKVFADRVIYNAKNLPRGVEYDLLTKEGQELLLKVIYNSEPNEESEPQNTMLQLPENEAPFAGRRIFHLMTTKNEEVGVQIDYSDTKVLKNIALIPPKHEGDVSEELLVESKEGFLISFNAVWKNGKMESARVNPYFHPFTSVTYYPCPKNE